MAYKNLSELFTAIANSIRGKTGGTEQIVANDFPAAIDGITGGEDLTTELTEQAAIISELSAILDGKAAGGDAKEPVIEPLEITENGTYTAGDGVDGYSPITVNVEGSSGDGPEKYIEAQHATVDLPNATAIKKYAFCQDYSIKNISMPNVESIGEYAFNMCILLDITSLPNGIKSIGNYSFNQCTKLALTSLPDALTNIGNSCFMNVPSMAITSIPSGVTKIGTYAFHGCTGISSITFKGQPSSIAYNSFENCTNLKTINVPWAQGAVANAPWGATNATINYNYTGG